MSETLFGMSNPVCDAAAVDAVEVGAVCAAPVQEVVEEKPYTIRGLCAKDIFPMTKIISKVGLKDFGKCFDPEEIKAITESLSDEDTTIDDIASTVGIGVALKIVDVILDNLEKAEKEIYVFLAGVSGMGAEDVENLSMDVFFELLIDVFKRKEFVGFMKVVSRLLK